MTGNQIEGKEKNKNTITKIPMTYQIDTEYNRHLTILSRRHLGKRDRQMQQLCNPLICFYK